MSSNLCFVDLEQSQSVTILDRVYPVKSVEWSDPSHPLEGTATYSFGGNYEGYTMVVSYKDHKMNGKATGYNPRGIVSFEVNYVDDILNGDVVIRDDQGLIVLTGRLHNGLREGVFIDKNEKKKYYYRGKQLFPSSKMNGYYLKDEKGKVEKVLQFSKDFSEMNGICCEYEGGQLKRMCEYKQGNQTRVLGEWNGTIMTEYNDQGNRRYEGEFGGSLNKGIYWKGKGTQYDENGRSVLYDGQWNNGVREGEGIWYKNANGLPTYNGSWARNVPNGEGTLFDDNGMKLYSGRWENGYLNVGGRKWVDYETGNVVRKSREWKLDMWVQRGGKKPESCCTWGGMVRLFNNLILFCLSFLFGYSLSSYGRWGWSCPPFFGCLFILLLFIRCCGDEEISIPFIIRCLIGAVSIASYHLFGVMGTAGRKGAFVTLIVVCSISLLVNMGFICDDCDIEKEDYAYDDAIYLFSFTSLCLISTLFISPWLILAVIAVRIIDYAFREKETIRFLVPFVELLYMTILLMRNRMTYLIITLAVLLLELVVYVVTAIKKSKKEMAISTPKSNVSFSSLPILEPSPYHIDDATEEPAPIEPTTNIATDPDSEPTVTQSTDLHAPSSTL